MRVIAGKARGLRLLSPPDGVLIRPTLDRVREAIFNILGPVIDGARFLDLFSGTGANGIEALSRGAREAVFVDGNPRSLALIRENLQRTRLEKAATCVRIRLPKGLESLKSSFDVVYADPPHDFTGYDDLLEAVAHQALLAEGGRVLIEHARRTRMSESIAGLTRFREAVYGETSVSFFS